MIKRIISIALLFTITTVSASAFAENEREIFENAISWLQAESTWQIRACKRDMHNGVVAFPRRLELDMKPSGSVTTHICSKALRASLKRATRRCRSLSKCAARRRRVRRLREIRRNALYQPGYGSMGSNPVADGSQFTVARLLHGANYGSQTLNRAFLTLSLKRSTPYRVQNRDLYSSIHNSIGIAVHMDSTIQFGNREKRCFVRSFTVKRQAN